MFPDAHAKAILDIWSERLEKTCHTITGNCMSPIIREDDSVVVEHGCQNINSGDVVIAVISGNYRIQRVIRKEINAGRHAYLLKGDQSSIFYESVFQEDIIGKVTEVLGTNGHLDLESPFWKCLNHILMIRSLIAVRCMKTNAPFWKGVNLIFIFRNRVFPVKQSLSLILYRWFCYITKKWPNKRKTYLSKPKRRT